MKRPILFILILCGLPWATDVRGQSPDDSIEVGPVSLRVGTAQAVVLQELGVSCALREVGKGTADSSSWIVQAKNQPRNAYANVDFKSGRLATVAKYWTVDEPNTEPAFANALYGAISSFERQGRTLCTIGTGQS
jgi:hypothetical protein